jgi:hypothetical protein
VTTYELIDAVILMRPLQWQLAREHPEAAERIEEIADRAVEVLREVSR